jgi:hypothetical protein
MPGIHLPSMRALVQIYRQKGDWESAAEILLWSEARTSERERRIELLFEAASVYREHAQPWRAAELLASLLAIDPGHRAAFEALAEIQEREERWERAESRAWPAEASPPGRKREGEAAAEPGPAATAADEASEELEIVVELEEPPGDPTRPGREDPETVRAAAEEEPPAAGGREEPPAAGGREEPLAAGGREELAIGSGGEARGGGGGASGEELAIGGGGVASAVELAIGGGGVASGEALAIGGGGEVSGEALAIEGGGVASGQELAIGGGGEVSDEELEIAAGADLEEIVARARAALADDPRHAPAYRALRTALTRQGRHDPAWCVCAAMSYLGCASESERLYHETYRPPPVGQGGERLTRPLWERIAHPALDPRVGVVTRAIGLDLALVRARPMRRHGLKAKDRRDTSNDQLALSRALERAAAMLEVALPDLYLEPDEAGELSLENLVHRGRLSPSLVARGGVLRGRSPIELACIAGRTLALLRSDLFLLFALPGEAELRATWEALIGLARPPGPEATADPGRATLERALPTRARAELALAVSGSGLGFGGLDIAAWRAGALITAQRVGLVLCGDPAVAAGALSGQASPGAGAGSPSVGELLRYAVSEDYFAVRRQLDRTIDAGRSAVAA